VCMCAGGGAKGEGERESQADSMLSGRAQHGAQPHNCEIMT